MTSMQTWPGYTLSLSACHAHTSGSPCTLRAPCMEFVSDSLMNSATQVLCFTLLLTLRQAYHHVLHTG